MITCKLPYNPVLIAMSYNNEVLTLEFKKNGNKVQYRSYKCSKELAYQMFYAKTAEQVLTVFNENIKGKLEVLTVK
jgi:aromatic ring-opening dioxygenase LigB subunit